jgi:glycerol-1-phosphate dehydrogenase [NAD(P)+]
MNDFLHQRFLNSFGADGRKVCTCGAAHDLHTRSIVLGEGALEAVAAAVRRELGPQARLWVVSDERTEEAAGAQLKRLLGEFAVVETILPADPKPVCTPELCAALTARALEADPRLIVSVGGGTLSDVGKKVSADLGVPNWGVMTSPSMDAHTSRTANLKTPGGTLSQPVTASRLVFCDPRVLEQAPAELFLAGLGDQLAKYPAYLDWRVSSWLFGEPFCAETAGLALQSARLAIQAARLAAAGPAGRRRACLGLADSLLASGLAMQAMHHSRPAASAEHTAAHFWEISHAARVPRLDLHGLLTGAATGLVHDAYREFYGALEDPRGLPVDIAARCAALRGEPSWADGLPPLMQPYRALLEGVSAERRLAAEICRESLSRFQEHRAFIRELADSILEELGAGVQTLREGGFPFDLPAFGLRDEEILLAFRYVRSLRNRWSSFDLMHLLGVEDRIHAGIERRVRSA